MLYLQSIIFLWKNMEILYSGPFKSWPRIFHWPCKVWGLKGPRRWTNQPCIYIARWYKFLSIHVDGTNFTKLNNKFMNIIKIPHSILSCSKSHFPFPFQTAAPWNQQDRNNPKNEHLICIWGNSAPFYC